MTKTYSIAIGKPPTRGMRTPVDLRNLTKAEVRGAMLMASVLYGDFILWVTDDDTGDIVQRQEPRLVKLA